MLCGSRSGNQSHAVLALNHSEAVAKAQRQSVQPSRPHPHLPRVPSASAGMRTEPRNGQVAAWQLLSCALQPADGREEHPQVSKHPRGQGWLQSQRHFSPPSDHASLLPCSLSLNLHSVRPPC